MVAHSGKDHEVGVLDRGLAGEAGNGREVPFRVAGGAVHLRDRESPGHAAHCVSPTTPNLIVMPGLDPGISFSQVCRRSDEPVDGRIKSGHDDGETRHRDM